MIQCSIGFHSFSAVFLHLVVFQVKMLSQVEVSRGHYDPSRNYDSRSSSPASSEHQRSLDSPAKAKPAPPPTPLKPAHASRSSRGLINSEPPTDSPEDPSQRSFLGKVKAFEQMDHFARSQRVLEIQEAQNARVSCQPCINIRMAKIASFTHKSKMHFNRSDHKWMLINNSRFLWLV